MMTLSANEIAGFFEQIEKDVKAGTMSAASAEKILIIIRNACDYLLESIRGVPALASDMVVKS